MRKLVFGLSVFLIGCGRLPYYKLVSIAPEFRGYVDDFIIEGHNVGRTIIIDNLSVFFTYKLGPNTPAQCTRCIANDCTPRISVNQDLWQGESDDYRRLVLFHELGHCVLFREHDTTTDGPHGQVTSIMYPSIQDTDIYYNYWGYYMRELFYGY